MDKLNLASFGERLKIGGAQMSRMVSDKVKDLLQTPTPESKIVDDATSEMMEEPNWGMNMRICAMINSEEFSGPEIVKAIKKKISSKSVVTQRFTLELLEACTTNCEKVASEVASEKVLDEMVKIIDNPQTDHSNREKAMQLIRGWGESEDLAYLPVFHQTYMSLKNRVIPLPVQDADSFPMQYSLESYVHQESMPPPERYPVPNMGSASERSNFAFNHGSISVEEKKEFLVITRNSLDLLSSMLNSETDSNPTKDELTMSMVEKCKESQPVVQRIIESTTDNENMLIEALSLHDELQQVISRYEGLEAASKSDGQPPEIPVTEEVDLPHDAGIQNKTNVVTGSPKEESAEPSSNIKSSEEGK